MGMHMSGLEGYWMSAWFAEGEEEEKESRCEKRRGFLFEELISTSVATTERIARGGASKG